MAVREVLRYPHPALKEKARELEDGLATVGQEQGVEVTVRELEQDAL